ncbi:hypothetical protein DFH09DRAFT_901248 [Mycena vulgaris]|nr:hypothetical protein DFH09DRAFT_901248 [Mycena vulgaris]
MDVTATQRFLNQKSLPPWFYLPFDTFMEGRDPLPTIGAAMMLKELRFSGRPLWQVYTPEDVLPVAQTKLLNTNAPTFSDSRVNELHTFAVYSHRICLHLNPSQSSQLVEVTAVESHMRLATGIHGRMLITACPSEPILALAAAIAINATAETRKNATQALVALVSKYRVDRGLEGELYSRLVLVIARDIATTHDVPPGENPFIKTTSSGPALRTVTLDNLLRSLLRTSAVPARYRDSLAQIGKGVYVTFMHFMELDVDVAVLDAGWCFDMICRGAAVQCTFGQPVIDGIIFGYRGDIDEPFDQTKLFLVCYQAKARAAAAAESAASLTCPIVRYRDGRLVKPEHVVILIDMAATAQYQSGGFVEVSHRSATVPEGSGKNWEGYCAAHANVTETVGDFIGIRELEPYGVFEGIDNHKLYRSVHSYGRPPRGAVWTPVARPVQPTYDRYCKVD